jgi:hypothetical protein
VKIGAKLAILKREVDFIAKHDDAEAETVEGLLNKGKEYIDQQIVAMKARRAEKSKKELADA